MTDFVNFSDDETIDEPDQSGRNSGAGQSKYWVFTWNNPPDELVAGTFLERSDYKYWAMQKEHPPGGTPHYQGYVVFDKPKRMTQLKKIDSRIHWDTRRGTHEEARDYATSASYKGKDKHRIAGPWFGGVEPEKKKPGKRNDIVALRDAVKSGQSKAEIYSNPDTVVPAVKYSRAINDMQLAFEVYTRKEQTYCLIFYGPPGTGKTTAAEEYMKRLNYPFYTLPEKQANDTNPWFDGYKPGVHKGVIINEMSGALFRPDTFCRLLDKGPMLLPTKGGHIEFNSPLIIFTSNFAPSSWWKEDVMARNPGLKRRLEPPICLIKHFTSVVHFVPPPRPSIYDLPPSDDDDNDQHSPCCDSAPTHAHDCPVYGVVETENGARATTFRVPSWVTDEEHRQVIDYSDESFATRAVSSTSSTSTKFYGEEPRSWNERQAYMRKHGHVAPLPGEPPCLVDHSRSAPDKEYDAHKERMKLLLKKSKLALK